MKIDPTRRDLIDVINNVLLDGKLPYKLAPSRGFYASAATVVINGKRIGSCPRKIYWDAIRETPSEKFEPYQMATFALGDASHELICEWVKKAGLLVKEEYEIVDTVNFWSGRVDLITKEVMPDGNISPDNIIPVEIKSVKGDYGRRGCVVPNRNHPYAPKIEHVLQNVLYLDFLQRESGQPVPYGQVFYIARDNGYMAIHYTELDRSDPEKTQVLVNHQPIVGLTIEGIHKEFHLIRAQLVDSCLPDRAYKPQYTKSEIDQLLRLKELNKADTAKAEKDRFVEKGDWQCMYCAYAGKCWEGIDKLDIYNSPEDTFTENLDGQR